MRLQIEFRDRYHEHPEQSVRLIADERTLRLLVTGRIRSTHLHGGVSLAPLQLDPDQVDDLENYLVAVLAMRRTTEGGQQPA